MSKGKGKGSGTRVAVQKTAQGSKVSLSRDVAQAANATRALESGSERITANDLKTASALILRAELAARAGLQFGGLRDLYAVFGYKKKLTPEDFLAKYQRQDIASRIVDAPPAAVWSNPPALMMNNTTVDGWNELNRQAKLWSAMYRADRLSRLNPFSLLLFGFDDSGKLETPVNKKRKATKLLYVRAIGSRLVKNVTYVKDARSPRFGLPETYTIQFDDPDKKVFSEGQVNIKGIKDLVVHHSRVVHVVENALEDSVIGTPIMEKVHNLLDDLLKVAGGTAETYWLTGNRGMQADVDKDMQIDPSDAEDLEDEIDEYMHQLRRFIRTRGVDLKVLDSKPPSPQQTFDMIIALISGTTGIPKRILLGSEAGQLASEQDRANWAERIGERRSLFVEPIMLEPTVDLLQSVRLLPEGLVEFEWPSAFIMSPLEGSQVMAQTARAIGNISRQTGNKTPMQLTSREEGRSILGLEGDLADSDLLDTGDGTGDTTSTVPTSETNTPPASDAAT